ncbi:DUF805 domain-containing protein [Demequina globuliformis]|uniref:DUF805 domain-containing protein n=1 Tax=Demequina globuliformis TaxID=676202 RepID=UPI0007814616|nr:DUF805 domain-containing protein [Demequina globuliformis]
MSFGDAIVACVKKYAVFSGRARRSEFWWFFLAVQLVVIPLTFVGSIIMASGLAPVAEQMSDDGTVPAGAAEDINWLPIYIGLAFIVLINLALLLPVLAAMSRRMHDLGTSGAWVLFTFIGLGIIPLVMCALQGRPGDNDHGPDPRAVAA